MSEEKVDPVDALHYIRDDIDVVANLVHVEIECLSSEGERRLEVLRNLVNKLDECQSHIDGAFQMAFSVRGHEYKGPNYGEEMKAARALVSEEQ